MFKEKLLTKKEFIDFILEKLRSSSQYAAPVYDEKTSLITWNDRSVYVESIYEDYTLLSPQQAPEALAVISERIKALLTKDETPPTSFEEALPSLFPLVRSSSYMEHIQQNDKIPYKLINEHLAVLLCLDTEATISLLTETWFRENNTDFDTVFNYAIQNLEHINEDGFDEIFPGVWRSSWKDGYDTSRILLGIHTTKPLKIKGDPVIFLPHREVLIITGSEDITGLNKAINFCTDYHGLNRSISPLPFTLSKRGDGSYNFEIFRVSEDHPLYQTLSSLLDLDEYDHE